MQLTAQAPSCLTRASQAALVIATLPVIYKAPNRNQPVPQLQSSIPQHTSQAGMDGKAAGMPRQTGSCVESPTHMAVGWGCVIQMDLGNFFL